MATQEQRENVQDELHIEVLPGTEIMTDVGKEHFVKSNQSRQVLVPQPSQDPHDPLNWRPMWKFLAIFSVSSMTFTQGFAPLALAPMFPDLISAYNSTLEDVIQFTGVTILILGFSNFIWAPISTSFGRRPVYLASQLICLACYIIRAKASTYGVFMGACILNGIGAGPSEILQPAVIADIFFLHDRGTWNTLYWVIYMGSLMVAPIIAGPMADRAGWQNFWWLNVGITGLSIILGIFAFPETKYTRVASTAAEPEYVSNNQESAAAPGEKDGPAQSHFENDLDRHLGNGGPSKKQWLLFQPNDSPLRSILFDILTPWKLFMYPIVLFASFVVSWSCSNFLILNLTQSQVFAAPPYNMSSQSIGFLNFAVLVGALIGLVTAGPFSDWVSAKATARNGGIREPEMRLPAMIPYAIIMIFGNIITSIGYERQWPWPVIAVLGYSSAGIQVAALPSMASTYAVDCYKPVAGSLFVAITVNKSLWGYGMGRFVTEWTIKSGFIPVFMTNMGLTILWCGLGAVFYFYGKTFRRWTKNSTVHDIE